MTQFHDTRVIKYKIFENTILLELKFTQDSDFNFKAGQYVLVYQNIDGKEVNRAFSIASNPKQKTIELLIRIYEKGEVSPKLFELREGDNLKIRGPFGRFQLNQPLKEETVFIAGGTGIAPLRSMVHELLENHPHKKALLIFSFKHEKDFFFKEEFEELSEINKNFSLITTMTQPPTDYDGYKGRVTAIIPKILKNNDQDIYICGPLQMINDTLNLLISKLNFKKEQIHIERWGSG